MPIAIALIYKTANLEAYLVWSSLIPGIFSIMHDHTYYMFFKIEFYHKASQTPILMADPFANAWINLSYLSFATKNDNGFSLWLYIVPKTK